MLKTKKVETLRNSWNERAAEIFVGAEKLTDAEAIARARGKAEAFAMCAQELAKAGAEE